MTTSEFSNAFDILLNSYNLEGPSIILDEYEKSVFLTKALWLIVNALYTGRNNKAASFEATEELRSSLRNLLKTTPLNLKDLGSDYQTYLLPKDLLYIVYEEAITDSGTLMVTPITWDTFHIIKNNPFKRLNSRRALRLDLGDSIIKVMSIIPITLYNIQYLTKPTPIVLDNFSKEVSIDKYDTITECKLDSSLHEEILERAVLLAIASKTTQLSQNNV